MFTYYKIKLLTCDLRTKTINLIIFNKYYSNIYVDKLKNIIDNKFIILIYTIELDISLYSVKMKDKIRNKNYYT